MSAPDFQLELSELAEVDFQDILLRTLQRWGEQQLAVYRDKINDALQSIVQNSGIGRQYAKTEWRVLPVEKHQIFYRINGTTIYVVRILHERMLPKKYLPHS